MLVASIFAPATTRPWGSVTRPEMVANSSAKAAHAMKAIKHPRTTHRAALLVDFMAVHLGFELSSYSLLKITAMAHCLCGGRRGKIGDMWKMREIRKESPTSGIEKTQATPDRGPSRTRRPSSQL